MIALDTNLLVRYLTKDDLSQFERAKRLIDECAGRDERLLINAVVLCELTWVLESAYGYSRVEIADALERILETAQFEIQHAAESRLALHDVRSTKAGFSDALIGRLNRTLGARQTATFDRGLRGLDTFVLV
jgi:predicted nucleic-acid-binding protein